MDALLLAGVALVVGYYVGDFERLYNRMENVDEVLPRDLACGTLALVLLLEAVRRVVGWSLLWVIAAFLAYAFLGPWFPGWLAFGGFDYSLFIEMMTMATHGILGVTTETSVNFVWYFILFGVVFSATGGGQLFIDSALRLVGRRTGGAAKAEIVSSAMFGTISGSAVANVVATRHLHDPPDEAHRVLARGSGRARGDRVSGNGCKCSSPLRGYSETCRAASLRASVREAISGPASRDGFVAKGCSSSRRRSNKFLADRMTAPVMVYSE